MDTSGIAEVWDKLAGRRIEFFDAFYNRLFERYPEYQKLFPDDMGRQRENMAEMFSLMARFSDHIDLVRPYLLSVGYAHRKLNLTEADLKRFAKVFVDALEDFASDDWPDKHTEQWYEAIDGVIVPIVAEGLELPADPRG